MVILLQLALDTLIYQVLVLITQMDMDAVGAQRLNQTVNILATLTPVSPPSLPHAPPTTPTTTIINCRVQAGHKDMQHQIRVPVQHIVYTMIRER